MFLFEECRVTIPLRNSFFNISFFQLCQDNISLSFALHNTLSTIVIIFTKAKRRSNNLTEPRYFVLSETFFGIPINFQLPGVKGTLVLRHISSRRKKDRDSQSIPLRRRRDIHKHPMSRSIPQTRIHPLRLGRPSDDLFVSVESRRGVCKNVLFAYLRDDSIPFICTMVRRPSCRVSLFFRQTEKNM